MALKFIKRILFVLFFSMGISYLSAQTTYYSGGSLDATNFNNWWTNTNGTGSNPIDFISGDDFIVQNGHSMTVSSGTWALDCSSLTINTSGAITVSGTANVSLTGSNSNTLNVNGSYTHNSTAAVASSVYRLGVFDPASTFTIGSNQTLNAGSMTFGILVISGSAMVNTNKIISLGGNLNINSTASLNFTAAINGSSLNSIGGGFSQQLGSGTLDTKSTAASPIPTSISWAGTVNYSSSSTQTIVGGSYTNLSGVGGNRVLKSGEIVKIAGTFTKGGGSYTVTGNTVEYNGTGSQTLTDLTYNNLTISNTGATVTASSGNVVVNGSLIISSGVTVNMTNNTLTGTLSTISGTGTIQTQNTSATPIASGKTWTQTINYNASTIGQTIVDATYANLTLSNTSGTQNAAGDITVTSNLNIASGVIFNLGTNQLSSVGGTIAGTGTIRTQRTTSALPSNRSWTQTVEYNASSGGQSVIVGTYASLTLSNTSGTQTVTGDIIVTNDLTIGAGGTFDLNTHSISGLSGTIAGTGILNTQETSSTPIPSGKIWTGAVVYSSTSSQTIVAGSYTDLTASNGNRTFSNSANINISGTFTPGAGTYTTTGSTITFNGSSSQTIPGLTSSSYNNLTASGGSKVLSSSTNISISGAFTPGSGTYTTTGSTVVFSATGSQSIPTLTSSSYNNLTASGTGTKFIAGDVTIAGTLSLPTSSDFLSINGNTLTLQGSTSLTGTLKGSSTSNLTISGTGGGSAIVALNPGTTDSLLNTLTLNRSGSGAGLTLGSNIAITKLLAVTAGTFSINDKIVTLKSTSITNTAQVDQVTGSINYGTSGSFTVERYIPNSPTNNRAYRDLSTGVNTNVGVNFFQTWQESGSSPSGYGTHISGLAGASPGGVDATTGLDITQTGNVSMYSYLNGVFSSVTNTKTTKPNIYQAYRVLIRGDRNTNLYLTPQPTTMSSATVLRANGQIVTGSLTYTTAGVAGNLTSLAGINTVNTAGDYSLLGNPYVCAIDWNSLTKTNLTNTYWVFDATIGTAGAYVTWDGVTNSNGSSNVNQYIQPGQGFFIETSAVGPQLVIQESNKAPNSTLTNVFRTNTTINKMGFGLSKIVSGRGNVIMDGCVAVFAPSDNNNVDLNDAEKFENNTENIFIDRGNKYISIEHRNSSATTDTIPLRLSVMSNSGAYSIVVDTRNFSSTNNAYLIDKYLNTEKLMKLNDTTSMSFTVNTSTVASYVKRFFIVFRSAAVPLNSINLNAYTKNTGVQVEWNTTNETQLASYEVEKSVTGISFNKIGSVVAQNGLVNNYTLYDNAPQKGANYYRIKIINQNGASQYSKTILVNLNDVKNEIAIYPNPVKGSNFSLQLNSLDKGNYTLEIFNASAQTVHTQAFFHNGGTGVQVIDWKNKKLATGNYIVSITSSNGAKITKSIFIEE